MKSNTFLALGLAFSALMFSCKKENTTTQTTTKTAVGKDINTATKVSVDRFSSAAAHLMVRTADNGLPAANAPINMDQIPFITQGLDKNGTSVAYYNFDVQSTTPAPIYAFFKKGSSTPVDGQHNVINTIPGDAGYNDFWLVNKVMVPDDYVANSITSVDAILKSGYAIVPTTDVVNCPVVPFGSTAKRSKTAGTGSNLIVCWYKDQAAAYFNFDEAPIATNATNQVPVSPIYVMFNDNAKGPSSGFKTTNGTQTHNVIATSPGDASYSPLWSVQVIDNAKFDMVTNLQTAISAGSMSAGANVNCPVVK